MSLRIKDRFSLAEKMREAKLYCVTCPPKTGQCYEEMVADACKGGADVLQLREKKLSAREIVILGRRLKSICGDYGALFIVNDRVDAALESGADGVHLGQDDLPLLEAKKIAGGKDFLIGCSTHSLEQALIAETEGADYIGVGPVYSTPTKPGTPAVGLDLIRKVKDRIKIPFVAIGGIDSSNVREVIGAGASCVAVVRAVFDKDHVEESARTLKKLIHAPLSL